MSQLISFPFLLLEVVCFVCRRRHSPSLSASSLLSCKFAYRPRNLRVCDCGSLSYLTWTAYVCNGVNKEKRVQILV